MKTDKEIKERISLIDDMIFHLEHLSVKDEDKVRNKCYWEMVTSMIEERKTLIWVLNK